MRTKANTHFFPLTLSMLFHAFMECNLFWFTDNQTFLCMAIRFITLFDSIVMHMCISHFFFLFVNSFVCPLLSSVFAIFSFRTDNNFMGIRSTNTIEKAMAEHRRHSTKYNFFDFERWTTDNIATLLPACIHWDGRNSIVGRRCHFKYRRIRFCLQGMAWFSRSHCRLSGSGTLLGWFKGMWIREKNNKFFQFRKYNIIYEWNRIKKRENKKSGMVRCGYG